MIFWGPDVFFGDDAFINFRQELACRDNFFTPIEQMQQLTGNNGDGLAPSGLKNPSPHGPLGVIKEGAYADILLVDGDPTQDLRLLMDADHNIDLIIKAREDLTKTNYKQAGRRFCCRGLRK